MDKVVWRCHIRHHEWSIKLVNAGNLLKLVIAIAGHDADYYWYSMTSRL